MSHSPSFSQPRPSPNDRGSGQLGVRPAQAGGQAESSAKPLAALAIAHQIEQPQRRGRRQGGITPTATRAPRTPVPPPPARVMPIATRGSLQRGAAAAGAGYANRNQGPSTAGAAAAGAGYANRNQSPSTAGAAAAGAGYANRNQNPYPNAGAAAAARVCQPQPVRPVPSRHGQRLLERQLRRGGYGPAPVGIAAWGAGSPMYGYGYSGYSNPYAAGGTAWCRRVRQHRRRHGQPAAAPVTTTPSRSTQPRRRPSRPRPTRRPRLRPGPRRLPVE